jgi:DNA-binding transcriptional LysR family regulator
MPLAHVRVLGWEYMGPAQRWALVHTGSHTVEVPVQPSLVSDNLLVLSEAALCGAGIAPMSALMCEDEIAQGRLRVVVHGWSPLPATFYAVYASRTALPSAGCVFLEELLVHLRERFGEGPDPVASAMAVSPGEAGTGGRSASARPVAHGAAASPCAIIQPWHRLLPGR